MPYPQGLSELYDPVMAGGLGMEQFTQAMNTEEQQRNKGLQDMMINQQKLPLEMDQLRAGNRNTNAQAGKAELDNEFTRATMDPKIKSEISKHLADVDINQLKGFQARLEQDLYSPDPIKRAEATKMYKLSADILKFKEQEGFKHGNDMEKQRLVNQGAANVAQIGADSRVKAAQNRSGATAATVERDLASGKINFERAAVAYSVLASTEEDPQRAQYFAQMAERYELANQKAKQAPGQGVVKTDPAQMGFPGQGGAPPGPTPMPARPGASAPQAPASQPKPSGQRISVMSPDGKRGTIPVEQLQDAMSAGYKQVK